MKDEKRVSDTTEQDAVHGSEKSQEKTKDQVSYDTYKRTVGEVKKLKEIKDELESKLNQFVERDKEKEEMLKLEQEKKLQEKGEFKKLLELKESELQKLNEKLNMLSEEKESAYQTIHDTVKLHAFYEKLPGKIKKREYLNFVNLDDIVINPETKEVDTSSVEKVVNNYMDNHPELVDTSHLGKLPYGQTGSYKPNDYDQWKNLNSSEMKKTLKEQVQKRLHKL